ncbi:MAG: hypothetical protein ACRDK9_05445 [Solirubrobacterales bacterium]
MSGWRLTVRHGSRVERQRFDDLDGALAAMERAAERVRERGPLAEVTMLRSFEPGERVAARLELSTGGMLRGRDAGVDVMGDGSLVAYAGGIRRRTLAPGAGESHFDAVRRALE